MYYCFLRRTEIIRLRIGDIDFENKTITVQSEASKNRKQECVTIPSEFEPILYEMGLNLLPKHWYIFSYNLSSGESRLAKPDYITELHRKYLDFLEIGKEKTLYSWKATGASDLFNATKNPYLVMSQCRHSDIKITMIYLRSLGLQVNEQIRLANFKL
jgi:integrase